jgi:sulfate permease, SulP family
LIPPTVVVVIVAIGMSYALDLEHKDVGILGEISSDFLVPSVPRIWDVELVKELLIPAVLIAVVGFVESTAIAKVCHSCDPIE